MQALRVVQLRHPVQRMASLYMFAGGPDIEPLVSFAEDYDYYTQVGRAVCVHVWMDGWEDVCMDGWMGVCM